MTIERERELIGEYLRDNSSDKFHITDVDTLRDGGTMVYKTSRIVNFQPIGITYYSPKNNFNQYHTDYPCIEENQIIDERIIAWMNNAKRKYHTVMLIKMNASERMMKALDEEHDTVHTQTKYNSGTEHYNKLFTNSESVTFEELKDLMYFIDDNMFTLLKSKTFNRHPLEKIPGKYLYKYEDEFYIYTILLHGEDLPKSLVNICKIDHTEFMGDFKDHFQIQWIFDCISDFKYSPYQTIGRVVEIKQHHIKNENNK